MKNEKKIKFFFCHYLPELYINGEEIISEVLTTG